MPRPMLISGANFPLHNPLSKHPSEIIDLRTPLRTLGPLEKDNNTGMQTSYVDLLDVVVYLAY